MFVSLFKRQPVATRADKMAQAMAQLDMQIASHEESAALQTQMGEAYRNRARDVLNAGGDRKTVARQLRRAAGCDAQVQHIEAVISSTAGQRQALELSAVHTASATAAEITRTALTDRAVDPDQLSDALDNVSELVSVVQATQDTIAGFAETGAYEDDDELIEKLLTKDLNEAPPLPRPPSPPVGIALPAPPTTAPAAQPKLQSLLEFVAA